MGEDEVSQKEVPVFDFSGNLIEKPPPRSFEHYVAERDPLKRMEHAQEYALSQPDDWMLAYSLVAKHVQRVDEVTRTEAAMKIDRAEKELQATPNHVVKFVEILNAAETDSQEEFEKLWSEFEALIPGKVSGETREVLDWLKSKVLEKSVLLLDHRFVEDDELRELTEEIVKGRISPYSIMAASVDKSGDILMVVPPLAKPDETVIDFLLSMAHERGHELLNKESGELEIMGTDTGIVFSEMFPILESRRVYASLSAEQKVLSQREQDIEPGVTYVGAYALQNKDGGGQQRTINVPHDEFFGAMINAYAHSLSQETDRERVRLQQRLLEMGIGIDEVRQRLNSVKPLTTSVAGNIAWKRKSVV